MDTHEREYNNGTNVRVESDESGTWIYLTRCDSDQQIGLPWEDFQDAYHFAEEHR